MRWAKPSLRNSFFGWLTAAQEPSDLDERRDEIRMAMLAALREFQRQKHPALEHRLRFAPDIAALWYARSDLMRVIAASQGEALAREHIASITSLFDGLLPGGPTSRPSPLSSQ